MINNIIHPQFIRYLILLFLSVFASIVLFFYGIIYFIFLTPLLLIIVIYYLFYRKNIVVVKNDYVLIKNQFTNLNTLKISYDEIAHVNVQFSGELSMYQQDDYISISTKTSKAIKINFKMNELNLEALIFLNERLGLYNNKLEISGSSLFLNKFKKKIFKEE